MWTMGFPDFDTLVLAFAIVVILHAAWQIDQAVPLSQVSAQALTRNEAPACPLNRLARPNVAPDRPAIAMPGHVHYAALAHVILSRRGDETGAKRVSREVVNVEPDQACIFLYDVTNRLIG